MENSSLSFDKIIASNDMEDYDRYFENCSLYINTTFLDYYYFDGNCSYFPIVEKIEFSLTFQIAIYIMYNLVFIAAVLGNLLVCYVVFFSPKMKTVTNFMIANLAIGDLLMALLCVPFSYISILLQYWPFGELLCRIVSPAQAVCVFVSAYTLVALAGDRYMAILYPLRPRLRRSQAVLIIIVVWTVAIFTAVPIAIFTRLEDPDGGLPRCNEDWHDNDYRLAYSLTLMILQYFFPIAVLIFTYTRIAVAVWGKNSALGEVEDSRDQRLARARRKTVVMSLAVVTGYTLAWLPLNLLLLNMESFKDHRDLVPYVFFACHWLAMSHTNYNVFIYAYLNDRFRSEFRTVLSSLCRCFRTSSFRSRSRGSAYRSRTQYYAEECTNLETHSIGLDMPTRPKGVPNSKNEVENIPLQLQCCSSGNGAYFHTTCQASSQEIRNATSKSASRSPLSSPIWT